MINRDIIKKSLGKLGINYDIACTQIKDVVADTYVFKTPINNRLLVGAITDGRITEDSCISILLIINNEKKEDCMDKVNELNSKCKYGKFYVDDEKDIAYSLNVPVIAERDINEVELEFCLSEAIINVSRFMEKISKE